MLSISFNRCIKIIKTLKSHPERISKIKPYINRYDSKEVDFPAQQKVWKKFELNNETIVLNILFVPSSTER